MTLRKPSQETSDAMRRTTPGALRRMVLAMLLRFVGQKEPSDGKKRVGSWILRNVPGMLTCREVEGFVFAYYEGTLPEGQQEQFDLHLALCPMCRHHFDGYVKSIELGRLIFEGEESTEVVPASIPEELVGAILLAREREGD